MKPPGMSPGIGFRCHRRRWPRWQTAAEVRLSPIRRLAWTEPRTKTNREPSDRVEIDGECKLTFGRPNRRCAIIPLGKRMGMLNRRASRDERIGGELNARSD